MVSRGEEFIQKLLIDNEIEYRTQVTFEGLVGIKGGKLKYDFGIVKDGRITALIEFDGSQHYFNSTGIYGDELYRGTDKTVFEVRQIHDGLKNAYAKENHIPLLRVLSTNDKGNVVTNIITMFINGLLDKIEEEA